jgi:hypothetical protein
VRLIEKWIFSPQEMHFTPRAIEKEIRNSKIKVILSSKFVNNYYHYLYLSVAILLHCIDQGSAARLDYNLLYARF